MDGGRGADHSDGSDGRGNGGGNQGGNHGVKMVI